MLRDLGWMPAEQRKQLAVTTDMHHIPALLEPYWQWFTEVARKCRESSAFEDRLGRAIAITSEGDLRRAVERLSPLVDHLLTILNRARHRSVNLEFADQTREWRRWLVRSKPSPPHLQREAALPPALPPADLLTGVS
jgi:hypothetical protein